MEKNFFDTTSIACRERVHSAVIGWMLSDGCTALTTGQKLDILCGLFHVKNKPKNVKNIEVRLEWNNIDILIITTSSQGSCCWVVENKLKSSQHDNQLDKYESIINKDFFSYNHHFLLLSLTEEHPICTSQNWEKATYEDLSILLSSALKATTKIDTHFCILREYLECIQQLGYALNSFLTKPELYPEVFVNGNKAQGYKKPLSSSVMYADYISECGLETIFQKALFRKLSEQLIKRNKKIIPTYPIIGETHGNAEIAFAHILVPYPNKKDEVYIDISFQGGTFKVAIYKDYNKPTPQAKLVINTIWLPILQSFAKSNTGWKLQTGAKPRVAVTKHIDNNWYKTDFCTMLKAWETGLSEAIKVKDDIIAAAKAVKYP